MKTIHDKLCDLHLNKLGNLRTCEKLNASHDLIEQLTLHASAAKLPPFSNFTVARCIHNIHIMISIVRINKTVTFQFWLYHKTFISKYLTHFVAINTMPVSRARSNFTRKAKKLTKKKVPWNKTLNQNNFFEDWYPS